MLSERRLSGDDRVVQAEAGVALAATRGNGGEAGGGLNLHHILLVKNAEISEKPYGLFALTTCMP